MEERINIACPCCYNKRLFDLLPGEAKGIINIKCPICKGVVSISLHNYTRYYESDVPLVKCAEDANTYELAR